MAIVPEPIVQLLLYVSGPQNCHRKSLASDAPCAVSPLDAVGSLLSAPALVA